MESAMGPVSGGMSREPCQRRGSGAHGGGNIRSRSHGEGGVVPTGKGSTVWSLALGTAEGGFDIDDNPDRRRPSPFGGADDRSPVANARLGSGRPGGLDEDGRAAKRQKSDDGGPGGATKSKTRPTESFLLSRPSPFSHHSHSALPPSSSKQRCASPTAPAVGARTACAQRGMPTLAARPGFLARQRSHWALIRELITLSGD